MSQYIGARYVPKFMGTYDNTQAYENMVVVDNGLGTSYISKVPVPAGTPLTDTNYWALYGASNGAIINLQNQIDDMNDGSVPGSLQNQIDTERTRIDRMDFTTRKFLFVGDSYGDDLGEWPYIVKNLCGIPDDNFVNRCVSGTGFKNWGAGTFYDQLSGYSGDKTAITDIVIAGGLNDSRYSTYADYETYIKPEMETCASYIAANYPNARVFIGYIGSCLYDSDYYATVPLNNRKLCMYLYNMTAMSNGWTVLAGVQNAIHTSKDNYGPDGIHPSSIGNAMIGFNIANVLKTGSCNVYYDDTLNKLSFTSPHSGSGYIKYETVNDMTHIKIGISSINFSGTLGTSFVELGTLSGITFPQEITLESSTTVSAGGSYKTVTLLISLGYNKISIAVRQTNAGGTDYETYSSPTLYNVYAETSIPTFNIN